MDLQTIREHCLAKPGVEETFPFDAETLVFKVMGKMFLLTNVELPESINIKCDPEKAVDLRERYADVQPGWHMNKKHWNTVSLTGRLAKKMLFEMIDDSYNLVVSGLPKAVKEILKTSAE
ncbi:MAG: MmcQ/YjbR family DNA-binding protein [Bacteroidota bacterium]